MDAFRAVLSRNRTNGRSPNNDQQQFRLDEPLSTGVYALFSPEKLRLLDVALMLGRRRAAEMLMEQGAREGRAVPSAAERLAAVERVVEEAERKARELRENDGKVRNDPMKGRVVDSSAPYHQLFPSGLPITDHFPRMTRSVCARWTPSWPSSAKCVSICPLPTTWNSAFRPPQPMSPRNALALPALCSTSPPPLPLPPNKMPICLRRLSVFGVTLPPADHDLSGSLQLNGARLPPLLPSTVLWRCRMRVPTPFVSTVFRWANSWPSACPLPPSGDGDRGAEHNPRV